MSEKALIKDTTKKDNFITFSSFVCAIMIVGLHSFNAGALRLNSVTRFIEAVISHGMFTGAVPLFLFTSGYLFYRNVNCVKDCLAKQKKRVISVVMPFFAWSTFYYAVYAIGNKVIGVSMFNPVDVSLLGMFKGILFYEYCFPLWFLWQLIIFVIISPLIFWILSKKNLSVVVWVILIVMGFLDFNFEPTIWGRSRMLFYVNYFAYYFTGCLMAKNNGIFDRIKAFINRVSLYLLSLSYIFFSVIGGMVYEGYIASFNNRCIVPFVAIAMWALLYKICSTKKNIKVPEKVSTIIVYAIHPIVGMVLGRVLSILQMPPIIGYFVGFIICAFISCLASVLMRYIKPVYWVFSGNR